jgi:hypothetical protein
MQITDLLARTGGLQSIARELGMSEAQASTGAAALLPAILGGFKKRVQSQPGGVEGLGDSLGRLGGGGLLDDVLGAQPTNVSRGNEVLGEIFGSKDVSRTVAQNAASQSGLDADALKKMLPMLAMLVGGFMAKQRSGAAGSPAAGGPGGLGGLAGGLIGGGAGRTASNPAATPPAAGAASAGIGSMLDLNGDGNALDDIMRMAGKAFR